MLEDSPLEVMWLILLFMVAQFPSIFQESSKLFLHFFSFKINIDFLYFGRVYQWRNNNLYYKWTHKGCNTYNSLSPPPSPFNNIYSRVLTLSRHRTDPRFNSIITLIFHHILTVLEVCCLNYCTYTLYKSSCWSSACLHSRFDEFLVGDVLYAQLLIGLLELLDADLQLFVYPQTWVVNLPQRSGLLR